MSLVLIRVCVCARGRLWLGLVLILPSSLAAGEASSLLQDWHDVWLFRFFLNVLGYTTIIIPGYFLITYLKRINYLQTGVDDLQTGDYTHVALIRWHTHRPIHTQAYILSSHD